MISDVRSPQKKTGVVGPNGLNYGSTKKIEGGKKGYVHHVFWGNYMFSWWSSKQKTHQGLQKG